MFTRLAHRLIAKSEQLTGERSDFLRDMLAVDRAAFWKFALFTPMARHTGAVPREAVFVARIAATHAEDCGPCLQTVINYATAARIDPAILRAAVKGDVSSLNERLQTVFRFAEAVVTRDPLCDHEREKIEQWWGRAASVELALAIASTRVFPTVKRAMGYAQACQQVIIAGETTSAPYRAGRLQELAG